MYHMRYIRRIACDTTIPSLIQHSHHSVPEISENYVSHAIQIASHAIHNHVSHATHSETHLCIVCGVACDTFSVSHAKHIMYDMRQSLCRIRCVQYRMRTTTVSHKVQFLYRMRYISVSHALHMHMSAMYDMRKNHVSHATHHCYACETTVTHA